MKNELVQALVQALEMSLPTLEHELAGAVGQLQRCGGHYVLFGGRFD